MKRVTLLNKSREREEEGKAERKKFKLFFLIIVSSNFELNLNHFF